MTTNRERLYNTPEDLAVALVDAVGRRDKDKVSAIGLYALTTQDTYPVDGREGYDYTEFIWETADLRLKQLQNPNYDGYYDARPSDETAA